MTAKEYLLRYKEAKNEITYTLEELEKMRTMITQVKAAQSDSERVKSSGSQDPLGNAIATLVMMEEEMCDKVSTMKEIKREIEYTLSQIKDSNLKNILCLRYLLDKSWEEIAITLNISYRHTTRLHGVALQKVDEIIKMS